MDSAGDTASGGGFPHSDTCGSKPVCRLPAAFRRLPRPSSPVIAKASTSHTWSLDPITLPRQARRASSFNDLFQVTCCSLLVQVLQNSMNAITTRCSHAPPPPAALPVRRLRRASLNALLLFPIFKELPVAGTLDLSNAPVTGPGACSRSWWRQSGSNR